MTSTIINSTPKKRNTNASNEQKQLLLEFMKKHPKLTSRKFFNDFTQKDAQSLWHEITGMLNSCGGGAYKDWKSRRKTWHDIRSRTKTKTSNFKSYQRRTGGGPPQENPNTDFENEVLETIKPVSIKGHTNVLESNTDFTFDSPKQSVSVCDMENTKRVNINDELLVPAATKKPLNKCNSNSLVAPLCGNSNILNKKIPRCTRKKLVYTSDAAENYRISLEKKNIIKSDYYEKKLVILERIAVAEEKTATSKESSAVSQERIASALDNIAKNLENFIESFD